MLKADLCVVGEGEAGRQIAVAGAALGLSVVIAVSDPPATLTAEAIDRALAALIAAGEARADSSRRGASEVVSPLLLAERAASLHAATASRQWLGARDIRIAEGRLRFVDRRTLACGDATIKARRFVLAPRAEPIAAEAGVFADVPFLTIESFWQQPEIPRRLVILGGSANAVEIAQACARCGSEVTLLHEGFVLAGCDPEGVRLIRRGLVDSGIAVHENTVLTATRTLTAGLTLDASGPGGGLMLNAGHMLVIPGVRAVISGVDLAAAGIAMIEGKAVLDKRLRTSNSAVYVVGQREGGNLVDPAASQQAAHVLRAIFLGWSGPYRADAAAAQIRTSPALVEIGLSEVAARKANPETRTLRAPLDARVAASTQPPSDGFAKVTASADGTLSGATIVGPDAGLMAAPLGLALAQRLKVSDLAGMALPPGSRMEALRQIAAQDLVGRLRRPAVQRMARFLRALT